MDREIYKNLVKVDQTTQKNQCDQKDSKDTYYFISDSVDLSYNLTKYIRENFKLCQGAEWILGFDMYVQDMQSSFSGDFQASIIERGHIVEYDVFGNIGSEQKKKRPAIVLLVNGNKGAIIAPIGKSAYNSGKHYHVSLEKYKKDQGNMKFSCGIKLEQIRYIDKNRITGKYGKVSNTEKLNEIDEKLIKNLSKFFYQKFETLKNNYEDKSNEVERLSNEILARDEEIKKLQKRVQILESMLKDEGERIVYNTSEKSS